MDLPSFLNRTINIRAVFRNAQIKLKQTQVKGFTLVEMIVVLAIIGIITSITLLSQSTFNQTLLLNDTAYSIAFSARQAQTFGLSSRASSGYNNAGYGLHFESGSKSSYILFADTSNTLAVPGGGVCPLGAVNTPEHKPGNCRFDIGSNPDGIASTFTFNRGFTVSKFCGFSSSYPTGNCSVTPATLSSIDIVFTRPNTTTTIVGTLASNGNARSYTCAEITLAAPTGGATRTVRISSLGEVSINQLCPRS